MTPHLFISFLCSLLDDITTITAGASFLLFRKKKRPVEDELLDEIKRRINKSADPCNDFYEYACGNWASYNSPPSGRTSYNGELKIGDDVSKEIHDALLSLDKECESSSLRMTKGYYRSCLDQKKADSDKGKWLFDLINTGSAEGVYKKLPSGVLQWPLIQHDYKWNGISVEKRMGLLKSVFGVDTLLYSYVLGSDNNSTKNILWLTGNMLPLGMSSLYLTQPEFEHVRKAYSSMQFEVALLLARDGGQKGEIKQEDVDRLLNFEVKVARLKQENHDDDGDDEITLEELQKQVPKFEWAEYFEELLDGDSYRFLKNKARIINNAAEYINALRSLLDTTDEKDVQNYLIWRLVLSQINYLSFEYKTAYQKFQTVLTGNEIRVNQTDICLKAVKGNYEVPSLGIGAAEALLKNGFNQAIVTETVELTKLVESGLMALINTTGWMDSETKENAITKLNKVENIIGFPDILRNSTQIDDYYKDLKMSSSSPFGLQNLLLKSWGVRQNLQRLAQINTRTYFRGSPVLTNAWYMNEANSITISLGEIHHPAIGEGFPNWARFGGIGALIGHEISHGFFDPRGAEYDGDGNKNNWWTKESEEKFNIQKQCLIDQFDSYCYDNSTCVNGRLTLAENAADLAGLKAAFQAFEHLENNQIIGEFTTRQLFFLSYPIYFCGIGSNADHKKEYTGMHSPLKIRVNGILRNVKSFSSAFNCPRESYMNLDRKCL
ncbi:unnamed protein product [Bursaphelenchus xylophilus]|uniref:(pine wood nematode) hypothetical protein n=1 Tax=Bursaphelenchus xylophilus TaxID=6326 RepID=A0A1I7RSW6_BURXY|nr:unnamed protein product [Bursaphelenchus xylophilus]CAG9122771.1 unnamed protein product [Bursaphelenchus xylophilus]